MSEPTAAQLRALFERQESRPGDGVMVFVFAKGEAVPADHPAVLEALGAFIPFEE